MTTPIESISDRLGAAHASRRIFLGGLAASLAAPLLPGARLQAQGAQSSEFDDCHQAQSVGAHYKNPLDIVIADPYVFHAPDGRYFMYGTGGEGQNAFPAFTSTNLVDWTPIGPSYRRDPLTSWCIKDFWAPEVFHIGGRFYMCYSAEWRDNPGHEVENFRIGIAVADSPAGPFRDLSNRPLFDPGYPVIDADLLIDDDGKIYLYYSRCTYKHPVESDIADWARTKKWYDAIEESWIYGVEVKPDFSGVIGEPTVILRPPTSFAQWQDGWENRSVLSRAINRRWTEGPCAFKHALGKSGSGKKNSGNSPSKYYLMYSANSVYGPDYALGYATAEHPLGPFTKAQNNPVVEKNTGWGGDVTTTAHNCVVHSPDGKQMYCLFGARTAESRRRGVDRVLFLCRMAIHEDGVLVVDSPNTQVQHPRPSASAG